MVDCTAEVNARVAGHATGRQEVGVGSMMRNVVRGILGLVFAALATWLANELTNIIFGPEEEFEDA
jgi:hypothetical protein